METNWGENEKQQLMFTNIFPIFALVNFNKYGRQGD